MSKVLQGLGFLMYILHDSLINRQESELINQIFPHEHPHMQARTHAHASSCAHIHTLTAFPIQEPMTCHQHANSRTISAYLLMQSSLFLSQKFPLKSIHVLYQSHSQTMYFVQHSKTRCSYYQHISCYEDLC